MSTSSPPPHLPQPDMTAHWTFQLPHTIAHHAILAARTIRDHPWLFGLTFFYVYTSSLPL